MIPPSTPADNGRHHKPPWPQPITSPATGIALDLLQRRPRLLSELVEAGIPLHDLREIDQAAKQLGHFLVLAAPPKKVSQ
jgi:hypothetical protein